ncbi:hypothetical protein CE91St43_27330 [Oscillospiraceae bacterium]|nr:hypothetical protein CE91St43_27330 [Oscillospiraceae bacterium]
MITIFNRAEVALTRDPRRQADIHSALAGAGIDYVLKTADPYGHAYDRARVGTFGMMGDHLCEYRFYVNRKDLELARHILAAL